VKRVFSRSGDGVRVSLTDREIDVLHRVPDLLAGVGESGADPAADRLTYHPHPDDPEADEAYRRLLAGQLEGARADDRGVFAATLRTSQISRGQADAWLRVIGEARLVLASRLGITEDGWSDVFSPDEPVEMSLLRLLGAYQDELVDALLGAD
jgi:hypothetical protein